MRVALFVLLLLSVPMVAGQGYTVEDITFTSHDGVDLRARLHTPDVTPAPAILMTHGWRENIDEAKIMTNADRFASAGYVVLTYDSRGWGKSDGQVELDGPSEIGDARALIDHLASLDSVRLDGPGDPRIAMVGQSYAGGIQLLTAAQDDRLDAIAPFTTWSNLLHSLAPGDVVKRGWVDLLFVTGETESLGLTLGGTSPNQYDPNTSGVHPDLARWYATIQANNGVDDEIREELGVVRSLSPGAINVPAFIGQGWPDTLFTPEDAVMTYMELRSRGIDARLNLFDGGHGGFNNYFGDDVMVRLDDFLAQYLRDESPQLPPYPVFRYRYAEEDFVGDMQWPPGGTQNTLWYLTDDGLSPTVGDLQSTLTIPPGPSNCSEIPNYQDQGAPACRRSVDGTYATFATAALTEAAEVTGTPVVSIPFMGASTEELFLFFHLVDIAPDGTETPVLYHIKPFRSAGGEGTATVAMPAITHTFPAGHQVGIHVSTSDLTYMGSREAGQVTLTGGATAPAWVSIPFVAPDSHGDQQAPRIVNGVGGSRSNTTETLVVRLTDNLALGNHTVTADGADVQVNATQISMTQRALTIVATAATCGTATVTVDVVDLVGGNASRTFDVVPCSPAPPTPESEASKDSPGGLLLTPLLLAFLLARRR